MPYHIIMPGGTMITIKWDPLSFPVTIVLFGFFWYISFVDQINAFEMDKEILQNILRPKMLILSRSSLLVSCWSLGRLHKGQWHRAGYIIQVDMARGSGRIWKIQHHTNYTSDAGMARYINIQASTKWLTLQTIFSYVFSWRKFAYFKLNLTSVCSWGSI